jgi:hypothetical protein
MTGWKPARVLGAQRHVTGGSKEALCAAILGGADLRIGTAFIHSEHIDPMSAGEGLIV